MSRLESFAEVNKGWIILGVVIANAVPVAPAGWAAEPAQDTSIWPTVPTGSETVYAPPGGAELAEPEAGGGSFRTELGLGYASAYVYRGVERSQANDHGTGKVTGGSNLQVDGRLTWESDGPWRPFAGVFANFWDSDPENQLQEVRPTAGVGWAGRPMRLSAGVTSYVYPGQTGSNTNEVFLRADLDERALLSVEQPIVSPYVLAAYDFDANHGWYGEVGISHDFTVAGCGLTLTPVARMACTDHMRQSFVLRTAESGTGWQHWDAGLVAGYRLNTILNLPTTAGNWRVEGYLFRTQHLADATLGDSVTWGGIRLAWER